ncbi:sialate O-acetylesterase [Opitutaceae bacterium TAV5]|nr:sialate O-acetylesterase [Opitutaceae bacterium TAV5]
MRTPLFCVSSLLLSCALHAEVVLAPLFRDGAVLQREKPVPVWGVADPGEKVTVTFADKSASAAAGTDGKWRVDLPALAASGEARTLTVTGQKDVLTVNDVVVGEVWLASGQSNMEWVVKNTNSGGYEAIAANWPLIRHYKAKRTVSDTPAAAVEGAWAAATPAAVGEFTAVGYYFAVDLYRALGVPVGIINSSWGGTRVEAWMDPAAADVKKGPVFAAIHERWAKALADYPAAKEKYDASYKTWTAERDAAKEAGQPFTKRPPGAPWGPGHPATPSGLYNGMIAPLVPYALRGTIWYQGESNAGRANEYRELFSAMITGWRSLFAQGDFPFYWVQLANYRASGPDNTEYAFLRGAQTETLSLPNTGQAVIIDIGNVTDIHPRNKLDVGRRLALVALARDYGKADLIDSGPVFAAATRNGASMVVTFESLKSPLISPLGVQPPGFELAGADQVFYPAEARIEGDTVVVTSARVAEPVAVRYAWRNAPAAGLFNREGLPAVPFRSDNW